MEDIIRYYELYQNKLANDIPEIPFEDASLRIIG